MKTYKDLPVYRPEKEWNFVYSVHPGAAEALKYNHDVDVIRFQGRFYAAWNANMTPAEGVPGQYNFIACSDDYRTWSEPIKLFSNESSINPISEDGQWQPAFINYRDEVLYCAWCTHVGHRLFISSSRDGKRWYNVEVQNAPDMLLGKAFGFPTNHGLITKGGTMIFPCSVPYMEEDCPFVVGDTQYSALLISRDHGASWHWSQPVRAADWAAFGEDPAVRGTEFPTTWEPMVFQVSDERLGLLVRNSTAQQAQERPEVSHQMLLCAYSDDEGETWTDAMPVELDTICSRCFACESHGGMLMIHNDNFVRVPAPIDKDRYHLSLYVAPVADPDLMLPGPLVQPDTGRAFYPNAFVYENDLYWASTYGGGGILSGIVRGMPDYSHPFLLPRGGNVSLEEDAENFYLNTPNTSLGLVLTQELTAAEVLTLRFRSRIDAYRGKPYDILTIGGKTRNGAFIFAQYDEESKQDHMWVQVAGKKPVKLCAFRLREWNAFEVVIGKNEIAVNCNGHRAIYAVEALRKLSFGGLYRRPAWPYYEVAASRVLLEKASLELCQP